MRSMRRFPKVLLTARSAGGWGKQGDPHLPFTLSSFSSLFSFPSFSFPNPLLYIWRGRWGGREEGKRRRSKGDRGACEGRRGVEKGSTEGEGRKEIGTLKAS